MTTTATSSTTPSINLRRPSDLAGALRWLNHGSELAYNLKGTKAKHSDVICQLLVEAVEVIDKTPDNERRWLTSGQRSGWNAPGLLRADLIALERVRILSAMKPFDDAETRYLPQRDDDERAL